MRFISLVISHYHKLNDYVHNRLSMQFKKISMYIDEKTREGFQSSNKRFLLYLYQKYPDCVEEAKIKNASKVKHHCPCTDGA